MGNSVASTIIGGLIGGVISSVLYPIVSYFLIRYFNTANLEVSIGQQTVEYLTLDVTNKSFGSISNIAAYITIDNTSSDIVVDQSIKTFCRQKIENGKLSWASRETGKASSVCSINQGETKDLQILWIKQNEWLQVPSELGYSTDGKSDLIGRALLAPKEYRLKVLLTSDNSSPKTINLKFDPNLRRLIFDACR